MLPAEKRGFRTCKRPAAGGEGAGPSRGPISEPRTLDWSPGEPGLLGRGKSCCGTDHTGGSQRELQVWDTSHPRVLTGKASLSTRGENQPEFLLGSPGPLTSPTPAMGSGWMPPGPAKGRRGAQYLLRLLPGLLPLLDGVVCFI